MTPLQSMTEFFQYVVAVGGQVMNAHPRWPVLWVKLGLLAVGVFMYASVTSPPWGYHFWPPSPEFWAWAVEAKRWAFETLGQASAIALIPALRTNHSKPGGS